jgi:hypothetical protein
MAYKSTTVPVEKSQGEIRKLLAAHGAQEFAFGEATDETGTPWAAVSFTQRGLSVRLRVALKLDPREIERKLQRARTKTREEFTAEATEQEAKRIWRVLAWNLKARMVAVDEGLETWEEAFLAHIVNPATGRTVYEDLSETGSIDLGEPLLALPRGS